MNTWSPIFARIVDSSLWEEEDTVVKVFITMLAKKDADHVVRGSAYNIAQWAKKGEADVLRALEVLSKPDTRRIEAQPYEGRRIERVGDGWLILNGQHYEDLMRKANRREYKRQWQAEARAKVRRGGSGGGARERFAVGSEEAGLRQGEIDGGVKPGAGGGWGLEAQAAVRAERSVCRERESDDADLKIDQATGDSSKGQEDDLSPGAVESIDGEDPGWEDEAGERT